MIGAKGVRVLVPFCVAMAGAMIVAWMFMPSSSSSYDNDKGQSSSMNTNNLRASNVSMDTRSVV